MDSLSLFPLLRFFDLPFKFCDGSSATLVRTPRDDSRVIDRDEMGDHRALLRLRSCDRGRALSL